VILGELARKSTPVQQVSCVSVFEKNPRNPDLPQTEPDLIAYECALPAAM
jgi:hypothetical protein